MQQQAAAHHAAQQQQHQQQQSQQQGHVQAPQRTASGTHETNQYIGLGALVSEAAKRAQMACLERDLGGVELG